MPPPDVVHRVHDRYLLEVVEGLGLCPFARRSREHRRVHRPLIYGPPAPSDAAARLHAVLREHPDAEIVLITFIAGSAEPLFDTPRDFDEFVKGVRADYGAMRSGSEPGSAPESAPEQAPEGAPPEFFMVGFHPRSGIFEPEDEPPLTSDSLVPKLRRTPDPVIQCVQAEVLQNARRTAQKAAHQRLMDQADQFPPHMRVMLERSIMPDSVLSAEIAEHNFEAVARGDGRDSLETTIDDIARQRDREYAAWWSAP